MKKKNKRKYFDFRNGNEEHFESIKHTPKNMFSQEYCVEKLWDIFCS